MSEFTNEGFNIGYRTGQLSERERIIALLEELRDSEYAEVMSHDDLIGLIKEENYG